MELELKELIEEYESSIRVMIDSGVPDLELLIEDASYHLSSLYRMRDDISSYTSRASILAKQAVDNNQEIVQFEKEYIDG